MDRELSKDQQIERLIGQARSARSFLGSEATMLRQKLDIPARLGSSLKSHPTGWLFGSAASGLAASLLFRRKPAPAARPDRGMPFKIFALILTLVRPMAKLWLSGQVKNYLTAASRESVRTRPVNETASTPNSFQ